ncbi:MAG: hypothetical protein OSA89_01945 [Mariniblastus sp.]|nr:hypothetical protein [Mariniblastus sp.]
MNEINDDNWKLKSRIILRMICILGVFLVTGAVQGQTTGTNTLPLKLPASTSVAGEATPASPDSNSIESGLIPAKTKVQDPVQLPANQLPLLSDGSSDRDPRLKGIFDRIKLLNKIIEEDKKGLEPEIAAPTPTPSELIFGNPTNLETNPVANLETNPKANPVAEPNSDPASLPPSGVPSETAGGSQVLAEPVNSLELGNSLYMTANYPAAIRSYSMLLNQKMDNQDAAWLRLMLGCCYRYQDDYSNAESIFRNVTNRRGAGDFLMKHTTWNLQYLEERRKRRDDFQSVEAELDALILEINNEPTQK